LLFSVACRSLRLYFSSVPQLGFRNEFSALPLEKFFSSPPPPRPSVLFAFGFRFFEDIRCPFYSSESFFFFRFPSSWWQPPFFLSRLFLFSLFILTPLPRRIFTFPAFFWLFFPSSFFSSPGMSLFRPRPSSSFLCSGFIYWHSSLNHFFSPFYPLHA